jgi:hypothetical protein
VKTTSEGKSTWPSVVRAAHVVGGRRVLREVAEHAAVAAVLRDGALHRAGQVVALHGPHVHARGRDRNAFVIGGVQLGEVKHLVFG